MLICRACGRLRGACTPWTGWARGMPYPFEQHCNCGGPHNSGECWGGFDFNEVITLCYCCGAVLLASGCKWGTWFCEDCKPRMVAINDVCGRYVVPLGRHSFQGSRWNIPVRPKNDEIAEFAETIVNMFERVAQLQSYAPQSARMALPGSRAHGSADSAAAILATAEGAGFPSQPLRHEPLPSDEDPRAGGQSGRGDRLGLGIGTALFEIPRTLIRCAK